MPTAILTSKVGYGTYIPAVYAYKYLNSAVKFYCIEDYFSLAERATFQKKVALVQNTPRIAEICSYLPDNIYNDCILTHAEQVISEWCRLGIDNFLCFSGKWGWMLNNYYNTNAKFFVKCIIMDYKPSVIWEELKHNAKYNFSLTNVFNNNSVTLLSNFSAIPYNKRINTVSIHGGGWALMSENNISSLNQLGFSSLSFLVPHEKEIKFKSHGIHKFYCDFNGDFPYELSQENLCSSSIHPSLKLIASTRCLITKPGGMGIMDAIMSETPILFDSITIGIHEQGNREWAINKGIAVNLNELTKENIDNGLLDFLHDNILKLKMNSNFIIQKIYEH